MQQYFENKEKYHDILFPQEKFISNYCKEYENVKKVFQWYSSPEYKEFNKTLRTNKLLKKEYVEKLDIMSEAFDLIPPTTETIVVFKGKKSNIIYSDKAFVSTTLDYDQTKKFSGKNCCVLCITVSPGSKVIPLVSISEKPEEDEVLLDKEGILVLTGSSIDYNEMKILFVTYLPKNCQVLESKEDLNKAELIHDPELISERIIKLLEGTDIDFLDENEIKINYKTMTGKNIKDHELNKIKTRLNLK